ncbi:MAG: c-type cytochrome [Pirellulales bacterium]|nr:c-type cytochrome [Pirellulales bacterium]
MPATESTWRNLKTVHVIFGVSSVVLLLSTIWMLAADHNRSWKSIQRDTRRFDVWSANARIDEQDTQEFYDTERMLQEKLDAIGGAALSDDGRKLLDQFVAEAKQVEADRSAAEDIEIDIETLAGYTDEEERRTARIDLFNRMQDLIKRVRFREDAAARNLKFRRAALDKASADYSLAVGNGESEERTAALQGAFDQVRNEVAGLTIILQDEKSHREGLEAAFKEITAESDQAAKALKEHQGKIDQLRSASWERANDWKKALELPIIDAFGSPLKPDQIWLPNLTLNNNFRDVARFDRCITCHQSIDKTQAGSATKPAFAEASEASVSLPTPVKPPEAAEDDHEHSIQSALAKVEDVYGLRFAEHGLLKDTDVTVSAVYPEKLAAQAGLMSGDTVLRINNAPVGTLIDVLDYLLYHAKWGKPLELAVRRGLPQPYCSHPKLDLFVGSLSPHPMGKFGCTICHQGQGSATSFEWASHTPNSPRQAIEWSREYGWFNNHHWIFPMMPEMFAESSCLKCHHEVVDLEPSAKFPEPPAPKVVKGYELIREFGCFGCHEINGYAGANKRIGPDLRSEPTFFAVAQQIKADSGYSRLDDQVKGWVETLISKPSDNESRQRLHEYLVADAKSDQPKLSANTQRLEGAIKDIETPGTFRKVGPSLRYVKSKIGYQWLYSWIRNPRDFRPDTKMPQFFGLWNHLVPEERTDEEGHSGPVASEGQKESEKYEPIEIRAITNFLLKSSQPFEYLEPFAGVSLPPSIERGKEVFETRGCLACHQHDDFPQAKATHGPNLSRIGAKLKLEPYGAKWLYSWVREPNRYHARTVMPNVMLTPIKQPDGQVSDPAADATAYLMQSTENWQPTGVLPEAQWTNAERAALYDLAFLHLKDKFPAERAEKYLKEGIPRDRATGISGDEAALVQNGDASGEQAQIDRMLLYVGRRTISKYGCYGCHDIPGYEDAKPIGTALADWGRKEPSKLAFEQIGTYITHHAWPGKAAHNGSGHREHEDHGDGSADPSRSVVHAGIEADHAQFEIEQLPPNEGWLMEKLLGHEREGFLWQKLREPRSYDFKKTETKTYNERLRMPQFRFTEDEIEAVMTFVLGLVSEPPAPQYLASYSNDPREKAVVEGTKVLEKFNCAGCHQLDFETWDVAFKAGGLGSATVPDDYSFLLPHFTQQEIDDSLKSDRRGLFHARLYGHPAVDAKGQPITYDEDEEGEKFPGGTVANPFVLWENALIEGKPWLVGGKNPRVPIDRVTKYPGRGGDLGRWIFPAVVASELKVNPNAKPDEAWGWLPPPLVGEGRKVQTNWLHNFLLDPFMIRPSAVLRMPKFNLSSADATALVDYFAARDDAPAPYEFDARTSDDYLSEAQLSHPKLLDDALKIVTDNNFCVKCHLVGDFVPAGSVRALAPQLDRVNSRLRPDYVHRWLANPKRTLPYTGMPVNIPYDKPVDQALFPGHSSQQLDGVVDLLMNWNRFINSHFSVKPLIKAAPAPTNTTSTNN